VAKETAHVLGVSESRFKLLEKFAHSNRTVNFKLATISRSIEKDGGSPMRIYSEVAIGNLVILHPGNAASDLGKGAAGAGKDVGVLAAIFPHHRTTVT